jgi:hypothetical protein
MKKHKSYIAFAQKIKDDVMTSKRDIKRKYLTYTTFYKESHQDSINRHEGFANYTIYYSMYFVFVYFLVSALSYHEPEINSLVASFVTSLLFLAVLFLFYFLYLFVIKKMHVIRFKKFEEANIDDLFLELDKQVDSKELKDYLQRQKINDQFKKIRVLLDLPVEDFIKSAEEEEIETLENIKSKGQK